MYAHEHLVTKDSVQFFYTASEMARKLFFYPVILGRYRYLPGYQKKRQCLDSQLLMLVETGSLEVTADKESIRVPAGHLIWIDCHTPHRYSSPQGATVLWIHFDGAMAAAYRKALIEGKSMVIPTNGLDTHRKMNDLLLSFMNQTIPDEAALSLSITSILTELFQSPKASSDSTKAEILRICHYINDHFDQELSLNELADMAGLSPYYFSRAFKKKMGISPHQYLIRTRIRSAQFYLKTSDKPVAEIAYSVGFKDESSFCLTFKRKVGLTPMEYRNS
jgi:AraC family transcriptional regulator